MSQEVFATRDSRVRVSQQSVHGVQIKSIAIYTSKPDLLTPGVTSRNFPQQLLQIMRVWVELGSTNPHIVPIRVELLALDRPPGSERETPIHFVAIRPNVSSVDVCQVFASWMHLVVSLCITSVKRCQALLGNKGRLASLQREILPPAPSTNRPAPTPAARASRSSGE